jgi:hypothetical protein
MADLFTFIDFKTFSRRGKGSRSFYLLPLIICLLTVVSIKAQEAEEEVPANLAPPPIKIISKEEKTALADVTDVKIRTRLAVDFMEARLKKAEELNAGESYSALLNELGGFQALMDDTMKFLNRNDDGRGKVMNNFKKFEMALRAFMPRLEVIRREMPERFEYYVRKLLRVVRDTRSKAVEPMFSNTIVPNQEN